MAESPLSAVLDILSSTRVHRVNVLGSNGRVVGVLSQTDIVRYIEKNKNLFKDELIKALKETGIIHGPTVSIHGKHSWYF